MGDVGFLIFWKKLDVSGWKSCWQKNLIVECGVGDVGLGY